MVHHRIDRVFEFENFSFHVHGDFLGQVAVRHRRGYLGNVSYLAREVTGHEIHVIGQVFPRSRDAHHLRLAAEFSFGADFARHARHFRCERIQLVHHRIDGVLEFKNLALHIDRDFFRQVSVCYGCGHFCDVSHLPRQVAGHRVHIVGQVLPGPGDARHRCLTAQFSFRTHFARDARHFRCKRIQLVHHRVDGVLEFEDFSLHVDRDLLG